MDGNLRSGCTEQGSSSGLLRSSDERGPASPVDETGDDGVDASSLSPLSLPFQPHLFRPFVSLHQTSLPRSSRGVVSRARKTPSSLSLSPSPSHPPHDPHLTAECRQSRARAGCKLAGAGDVS